ncbi:blue copper protein 1a-like [Telopea speciosissima]|uniref:blue copper protein 1a-like n=1 Tax=Telopea speciosissima TaxID=54955 RepID=UPI001CC60624|nr:blue copper protein 1a-like [Telopea speciosissima]
MGFCRSKIGFTQWLILVIMGTASMLAVSSMAKTIMVGGSEGWHFGFNYTDWAFENGPFYLNDTLVFKFDPPNSTTFPHSVYLLRDFWSFLRCDLKKDKMVANVTDGGGEGFKFVLKRWQPYYFSCGERNGFHCNVGRMKFVVFPMPRCRNSTHG